jgi:hypothetical protein
MVVLLDKNIYGILGLIFIGGGIIWMISTMVSSGVDAIELSQAESADEENARLQKNINFEKFLTLTKKNYPEFQENENNYFPNDDRLDKFLLEILIWFGVGIFDKRQIIGKEFKEIQSYVITRVNHYIG